MLDIKPFIDVCLDKIGENGIKYTSQHIRDFMDTVSPYIDEQDILSHLKFDPSLIPFLFKGWWDGQVYTHANTKKDGVYEVKNNVLGSRFVFWLVDSPRMEYYSPGVFGGLEHDYKTDKPLPKNMSEFVQFAKDYGVVVEMKDFPFQSIGYVDPAKY